MKTKILITLSIAACAGFAFVAPQQDSKSTPWVVPDNYVKMKNPVKSSSESISDGKNLFGLKCQPCHGKKGLGDGPKAANLKSTPVDLSSAKFQEQSDGAIFYKINEGKGDMPKFKKEIRDADDVWSIVNYVRTLKKK